MSEIGKGLRRIVKSLRHQVLGGNDKPSHKDLQNLDSFAVSEGSLLDAIRNESASTFLPYHLQTLRDALEDHPKAFGLAVACSFCRNGYVREQAVRNLIGIGDQALPFLLLRSCDWVERVRMIASEAVETLLLTASPATLQKCIRVLPVLDSANSQLLPAVLKQVLDRPGVLAGARLTLPPHVQKFLIDRKLKSFDEAWLAILAMALTSKDTIVIETALKQIPSLSTEEKRSLFEPLLKVKRLSARVQVIEIAEDLKLIDLLKELVDDNNWRTRNNSRYALKKLGFDSFVDHYRSRLPLPPAIAGFGEVAAESDLDELIPFLNHPSPRVRVEVVRAFKNRECRFQTPLLAARLEDDSPRVVRASVHALIQLGYRTTGAELSRLIRDARSPKHQSALLGGFALIPRWEILETALDLFELGILDETLAPGFYLWSAKGPHDYTGPKTDQLERLKQAFQQSSPRLAQFAIAPIEKEMTYWSSRLA